MFSPNKKYLATEWKLFIDSNKTSLKAVLHNRNKKGSISVAYSTKFKETYKSMKHLLTCIGYEEYKWCIRGT